MSVQLFNNGCPEHISSDYRVEITENGTAMNAVCQQAKVRERLVDEGYMREFVRIMSYCLFTADFSSPLTVRVTPSSPFRTCRVRPETAGVTVRSDCVEIRLEKPARLSVEFDENVHNNLFLFADAAEADRKPAEAENLICYEPGVYDAGEIVLTEGQTLYLAGGAYVYGHVTAKGDNITICGEGVLSGEKLNHDVNKPRRQLISMTHCKNPVVRDVTLLDSPGWTLCTTWCRNVTIDNIKEICWNENSDGLDICGTSDVLITNVFLRNADDNISVKGRKPSGDSDGDCRNIICRDCVFWCDKAHNMLIGPEADAERDCVFEHITFDRIYCPYHFEYSETYQGVMAIFCADNCAIRDISWSNITVEDIVYGRLISIIYTTVFAKCYGRSVDNIRFSHIDYRGRRMFLDRIRGLDENHRVTNVTLEDVSVCGVKQTGEDNNFRINGFTDDIRFC